MMELGRAILHEWALDETWLTVNHGSYGATPLRLLAAQDSWRRQMEAQPTRFMNRVLPQALRAAADALATFVGTRADDIAFLDNATVGCNAVLRSLHLQPDDEVLTLAHGYGAVRNTVRFVTERAGARMTEASIPFPQPTEDTILAALDEALTPRTRLAVLDHITSASALVLPIAQMIALCRQRGIPVLIDGAHAPGHVSLDIPPLGADWYVGNCHKWLCAPKGSAFLWAAPDRQHDLHPVTISHGYEQGFLAEFDWTGTRDPTAFLTVPDAIAFHEQLGGASLRARNHALAVQAAGVIARRLNTDIGAPETMMGAMAIVRLPTSGDATRARALSLRGRLLDAGTDLPVHTLSGAMWLRLSAFAYNEISDYERLAECVAGVLG